MIGRLAIGDPVELITPDGNVARRTVAATLIVPSHDATFIEPDPGGPVTAGGGRAAAAPPSPT